MTTHPDEPKPATLRSRLARLLGLRRNAGDELRTTIAILKAQQEATLDGILVVDRDRRVLSYNTRFLEIWGIPPSVAATAADQRLLRYARDLVADPESFLRGVDDLYTRPEEVRTGETIELRDGRTLSRSSVPVRTSDGEMAGRAFYFRDITEVRRSESLQSALFRISQLSRESRDLAEFYPAVHSVVGALMDATNFYIAEYDAEREVLTFPYFVDQFDTAPGERPLGRSLTAQVLRSGEPMLVTPERFEELLQRGDVELIGSPSVDWLGVPLRTGERTWGVLGVQTYDEGRRYTDGDCELLQFVSEHVASAIEHKRKEEALRESERRHRQMFENTRAVQLILDPATGEIVDANMAACDFYLHTLDELRTMKIWDINVLGEQGVRKELLNAATQERSYFNFRHMRANGEIRDVEVHSGPIEVGGRRLLYSIIHDVTERTRTERALQQSEEKYRSIFDHASVGIVQSTRDGHLITANTTMARMLGYETVDELLQVDMARDVWFDASEREYLFRKFEPRGYADEVEVRWKRKDGFPIWVQITAHFIGSPSGVPLIEGFIYDISNRKLAEESLAAANSQRKAVLDAATRVSIIATDAGGTITVFNSGAEILLGYAAGEMIGRRTLLDIHDRTEVNSFDALVRHAAAEELEEREWTYIRSGGERRTFLVSVTALRGDEGTVTGFLHVGTDITERKQAEEMLRQQSAAMTASMDGIGIVNEQLEFTHVNDALAKLYGYPRAQAMLGRSLPDLYDGADRERLSTIVLPALRNRGRWRGEATGRRRDGFSFPQEMSLTAIDNGGVVCVVRDITERTYAEEQIKHLAYHDVLTGLPNRLLFKDRLTVALSHAQRDSNRVAVLFLDLDRFKVINDSLGHNVGDQLLQAVAIRVQACVRESDTVARLGGDEFTVLLPGLGRSEDAAVVAQKILESIRYPFHIEGREFFSTTSVGISVYPEDGTDASTLIKNADTAMYQAKELGRDNYQLFNAFVNAKALQRIAMEHGLRRALPNGEFDIHYQPIFDLRSGRISGVEALLRWTHPDMGCLLPNTFIPIAEGIGMMVPIGMWVLRTACEQARKWRQAGFRNLSLAVNLSVTQLQQNDLIDRVQEVLQETGVPAHLIELEITESSAMQSPDTMVRTLAQLKQIGVRISLDDFGTGHSSLSYLKRFPIDTLKIDQSFVRDINSDPDAAAIVIAIIAMAHSLRLKVIAEGVELTDQASFLKRHGCDQMQGYLVKPPVTAGEFLALISEESTDAALPTAW
ncbi:MAG TPA: EAL domain-containing protein [Thermoanaerobaculia bacterium]|nr:EAL domain-containing protein [Thermoanaerobaculia bacterium]